MGFLPAVAIAKTAGQERADDVIGDHDGEFGRVVRCDGQRLAVGCQQDVGRPGIPERRLQPASGSMLRQRACEGVGDDLRRKIRPDIAEPSR